jgi:hypothetical protein
MAVRALVQPTTIPLAIVLPRRSRSASQYEGKNQTSPSNHQDGSICNAHNKQPPNDDPGNDMDSDEWYDKNGSKDYNKNGGASLPSHRNWWDEHDESRVGKYTMVGRITRRGPMFPWIALLPLPPSLPLSPLPTSELSKNSSPVCYFPDVFIWAYFVVPTWKNRRLRVELQARTCVPISVPAQGFKR